jgi:hypothetical protein
MPLKEVLSAFARKHGSRSNSGKIEFLATYF